jgi:hypothetical protein
MLTGSNDMELRRTNPYIALQASLSDLVVLEARGDLGDQDVAITESGVSLSHFGVRAHGDRLGFGTYGVQVGHPDE